MILLNIKNFWNINCIFSFIKMETIMDLQAEIKWIESALSESKDPTFV